MLLLEILKESIGEDKYWFNVESNEQVTVQGFYNDPSAPTHNEMHHTQFVKQYPELFGLDAEDLPLDPFSRENQQMDLNIVIIVGHHGWVRINTTDTSLYVHALNKRQAQKAIIHYMSYPFTDVLIDLVSPDGGRHYYQLDDEKEIMQFIRTGVAKPLFEAKIYKAMIKDYIRAGQEVILYENPSAEQLLNIGRTSTVTAKGFHSSYQAWRALVLKDGRVMVWDVNEMTHAPIRNWLTSNGFDPRIEMVMHVKFNEEPNSFYIEGASREFIRNNQWLQRIARTYPIVIDR